MDHVDELANGVRLAVAAVGGADAVPVEAPNQLEKVLAEPQVRYE